MKYIDAEKLKEEIQANLAAISFNDDYQEGYEACGMSVLKFIDSLQQEQKEDLSSLIAKAQSVAKRLLDSHSFYEALPEDIRYEHTAEKWRKILKAISSCSQQEQPDVDLEKEIDNYLYPIQAWQIQEAPFTTMDKCARHFAKWQERQDREIIDAAIRCAGCYYLEAWNYQLPSAMETLETAIKKYERRRTKK